MLDVVKAWLTLFWEKPTAFLLPEWSAELGNRTALNYKTYFWVEKSYQINKEQSYGLFFSPNWNLWKVNVEWETVKHKLIDCEDYITCVYADLDKKESS